MKRMRAVLVMLSATLGLALLACGGPEEGSGRGVVRDVDREQARVTIEHGEIPGMMSAMTMSFSVAEPEQLEGLEKGDRVDFRLRHADGAYTVMSIEPR